MMMTPEADRQLLLRMARRAIEAYVTRSPIEVEASVAADVLARRGGVFVTIHCHGVLRGCIGHLGADDPLGEVIPRCAVAACSSDPRFPGVRPTELADLDLELSLLGDFERASGPGDIEVGRHGVMVEQGRQRGLLLPQVAVEWGWDAETFLAHTCHKAGLPRDAWQRGATLWRYEAEVFSDGPKVER